ncbi:MAG: hypothetical protein H7281_00285 [Bacteriovorax sp.]|nr:hypothetical protein [Bacteriovorax sp.]
MFKYAFFLFMILMNLSFNFSFAKDISIDVLAKPSEVTAEMNEEQLLTLNGYRQAVTSELEDLKLNSELFWSKLDQKKMSSKEEAAFLQSLFENVSISVAASLDPKEPKPEGRNLSGNFKALLNPEKLKMTFLEVTTDLAATKLKTFYLEANIDLDDNMTWDDVGVMKPESFRGVILDSWKKLIEKEIKGFESVLILEKDLSSKPDYMNTKSVILKWTSTFKKVSSNTENYTASYELSAHYILQNAKSGSTLLAFDFPVQKRDFDIKNKKALSSSLASLVYNLLLSQSAKINSVVESNAKTIEQTELEIKILSKAGLTEIYQINSLLQEKFKDLKLTSQMKSYSTEGSTLIIRAEGSVEKILDRLSVGGGKYSLNEQKVLLFNRADKTFAILPKDGNN